jgi:hypothetical protein
LNNVECDIFIIASVVEWSTSIIIGSAGRIREIFDKTLNYSLGDFFIVACRMEEFVIDIRISIRCTFVSLENYFT